MAGKWILCFRNKCSFEWAPAQGIDWLNVKNFTKMMNRSKFDNYWEAERLFRPSIKLLSSYNPGCRVMDPHTRMKRLSRASSIHLTKVGLWFQENSTIPTPSILTNEYWLRFKFLIRIRMSTVETNSIQNLLGKNFQF